MGRRDVQPLSATTSGSAADMMDEYLEEKSQQIPLPPAVVSREQHVLIACGGGAWVGLHVATLGDHRVRPSQVYEWEEEGITVYGAMHIHFRRVWLSKDEPGSPVTVTIKRVESRLRAELDLAALGGSDGDLHVGRTTIELFQDFTTCLQSLYKLSAHASALPLPHRQLCPFRSTTRRSSGHELRRYPVCLAVRPCPRSVAPARTSKALPVDT